MALSYGLNAIPGTLFLIPSILLTILAYAMRMELGTHLFQAAFLKVKCHVFYISNESVDM